MNGGNLPMGSNTGASRPHQPAGEVCPDPAGPEADTPEVHRWRWVFPGERRSLGELRRWLAALLPECSARDDMVSVATELASNALLHTASGRGGWYAVEVIWTPSVVRVVVADRGGPAEPRVIEDADGESGRGLLLVRGLSMRTGVLGDQRGRVVWADIAWGPAEATAAAAGGLYEVAP
jgi:serine/threonine-protein kinase RsbW